MRVRVSNVRGTYLYLNTKQIPNAQILRENPNAKAKYGGTFILDGNSKVVALPADPTAKAIVMDDVIKIVGADAWKDKATTFLDSLEGKRKFYRDGNKQLNKAGEISEGFAGLHYIVAKNDKQPKFFSQVKDVISDPAEIGRLFSWGSYFDIVIDAYATDKGSKGIFAELQIVQFRKKGDALGAGPEATEDDLDTLEAETEADDLL